MLPLATPHLPSVSPAGSPWGGNCSQRPPCLAAGEGGVPGDAGRGQCCSAHGARPNLAASLLLLGLAGLLRVPWVGSGEAAGSEEEFWSWSSLGSVEAFPLFRPQFPSLVRPAGEDVMMARTLSTPSSLKDWLRVVSLP